jgi:hypothetical protein
MDMDLADMVNNLFNFNVLVLGNDEPDIQVLEVSFDSELVMLQDMYLGSNCVITIVNNMDERTKGMCPYFRVAMSDVSPLGAINFKLQNFYQKIGMSSISARCRKAIVVGLHALNQLDSAISVPMCFCTTNIEPLLFEDIVADTGVDMSCMETCHTHSDTNTLCDIAGLCIPVYLPVDVQWKILSYCKEPCAQLISDAIDDICKNWDAALFPMFQQREPRIPASIASFYSVLTVSQAIANATNPFLVPPAAATRSVLPRAPSS